LYLIKDAFPTFKFKERFRNAYYSVYSRMHYIVFRNVKCNEPASNFS